MSVSSNMTDLYATAHFKSVMGAEKFITDKILMLKTEVLRKS